MSYLYVPILAALDFVTPPHHRWLGVRSPAVQETFAEDSTLIKSSQEVRKKLQKFARSCKSSQEVAKVRRKLSKRFVLLGKVW